MPSSRTTIRGDARRLAEALVAGPWREADLIDRGSRVVGEGRWLPALVTRLLAATGVRRPTAGKVADFLTGDAKFIRACGDPDEAFAPLDLAMPSPVMWPAPGAPGTWAVPGIIAPSGLAEHLGIGLAELEWLADPHGRERKARENDPRRYRYRWVAKRSGERRLVEVPRPRLRGVQRAVLQTILAPIPPHEAAHGFRIGRSVRTYVAPHVGRDVVLKLDLRDFFPTITSARVTALFLAAGYPEPVARLLSGLATNRAPSGVWSAPGAPNPGADAWRARRLYQQSHLPQGAPTSPALANLCAYRLDARLSGLARAAGAAYTRSADDLAFSGGPDFARRVGRFAVHACAVALEEGFVAHTRKTRIMRRGVRQRIAGVVVNARPNVCRADYDTLKATLHNCARLGPASQNRSGHPDFRAHLLGRIAHVGSLNPERGRRLREAFEGIAW